MHFLRAVTRYRMMDHKCNKDITDKLRTVTQIIKTSDQNIWKECLETEGTILK